MNLWDKQDIPHKGWVCIDIEDVKETLGILEICEMCNKENIRFLHSMEHPEYPKILKVGCVCAGKMSEDYEGTNIREGILKNRLSRKKGWLSRKWKISQNGNPYLTIEDNLVIIFNKYVKWKYSINGNISKNSFFDENEAKIAAFNALYPPVIKFKVY